MKQKISITIDEEMITLIEDVLKTPQFRNRSHVIEHALHQTLVENYFY